MMSTAEVQPRPKMLPYGRWAISRLCGNGRRNPGRSGSTSVGDG
jgi:hypothetical protein